MIKKLATVTFFLFSALILYGQTFYVRQGASGNGQDWATAYSALPNSLVRGATYFVADGSYLGYTCDDVESGTSIITIKKATATDHGTSIGWQPTYGDGQAVFNGDFIMQRDYYTIDGQYRNPTNWKDDTSYGFKITAIYGQNNSFPPGGDNIVVQYVTIGSSYSENYNGGGEAVYCGGFAGNFHHWSIKNCFLHNSTHTIFQFAGVNDMLVEYCFIGPGWGKEAIRGQNNCYNTVIRHNIFYNASQTDPNDNTSGITAEIALWDGSNFNNNEVYGNSFFNSKSGGRNSVVVIGGNGSSWAGPGTSNSKVYNNTFAGIAENSVFGSIVLNGSNNEAKNNLFYNTPNSTVNASSVAGNIKVTSDPFVNYAGLDYRLRVPVAGVSLAAAYNKDTDGKTRGYDGVWDSGAFEYGGSVVPLPSDTNKPIVSISSPINDSVVSNNVTVNVDTSDSSGIAKVDFSVDGNTVASDSTFFYSTVIDSKTLANGNHILSARSYDTFNNFADASINIIVDNPAVTNTPPPVTNPPPVGVRFSVAVSPDLRVRSSAGLAGTPIGTQLFGSVGTVIAGPVSLDGYIWYNLDYENSSIDGWSIEKNADGSTVFLKPESTIPPPPLNQAPQVNAGTDITTNVPAIISLTGAVSDDGLPVNVLTSYWSVVVGDATIVNSTVSFNSAGTYVLRLTASDSSLSTSDDITINVVQLNIAPTVNAGDDIAVLVNALTNLSGSANDDGLPNNSLVASWSKVSGPGTVTFGNSSLLNTSVSFSSAGSYVLSLSANDSLLSSSDTISVTVNSPPANAAPVANTGFDRYVSKNGSLLVGSASDDGLPVNSKLVYTWTRVSGPTPITFTNTTTLNTYVNLATPGTYTFRLKVSDGSLSKTDDVKVIYVAPPIYFDDILK